MTSSCMSDLNETDSLTHLTRFYSKDIGMLFRMDKYSRMVSKTGTGITSEGVKLSKGNTANVQGSYLGIPQANVNHDEATRKSATTKYIQRLRQVLRQQNGLSKIQHILMSAVSVIRYPADISVWSKEEMEANDIKTQKLLKCMKCLSQV